MALSPENHALLAEKFGWAIADDADEFDTLRDISTARLSDWLDAARAQGRASLEERVRLLEAGLRAIKGTCSSFCDCDGDFVAGEVQIRIDALLAPPGERENG